MMETYIEADAVFSNCGRYRYLLRRMWRRNPHALFVMLNPSTASATADDPTIRSCVRLTKACDYGGLAVVNLFGLISADPRALLTANDAIGPDNEKTVRAAMERCAVVILAWGAFAAAETRARAFLEAVNGAELYCFGKTKSGAPKHPLYIKTGTPLESYP